MRFISHVQRYHHGNLRPALIKAGFDLLQEGGIEALTLRKCALRAGVSHAAPAHHFAGLQGLKTAIAAEGFSLLCHHLRKQISEAPQTPKHRLQAFCHGYVQFHQNHRDVMALIFVANLFKATDSAPQIGLFEEFDVLQEVCAPFVALGADPAPIEMQILSLLQGFSQIQALQMADAFTAPDLTAIDQFLALLDLRTSAPPS